MSDGDLSPGLLGRGRPKRSKSRSPSPSSAATSPSPPAPLGAPLLGRTACVILSRILRRNVDSIHFAFRAYQHAQRRHMSDRQRQRFVPPLMESALEHYGKREDAVATFRF